MAKSSVVLSMLFTLCMLWAVSPALAQEDPFGSQYSPPPTAPPSDPCGEASGSGNANCEEPPEAVASGSEDNASGDADDGSIVISEPDGPVVDLLPTTGGIPVAAAALLGGSALLGAGVVAVRRR
ncbi:LPXTG cell wall anchor domain-containing protein [Rubrobacter indicoceani]|uniref:LPXTG cell wall anchor domain-containing protein n=1 Tax=Rubrobacter indicoceani TaxID=2051957 RepID=UPI000E5C2E60|nr:LPXTG cell wall anchor domain-containing protein [Rubrobacter indicoceani]